MKEILEKKIKEEISLINKEILNLNLELKEMEEKRKKTQKQMIETSLKVAEFQSAKTYDSILEKQIVMIGKKIQQWEKKKEEKQRELTEKKKEIKAFETIRENQLNNFLIDERREELKAMNEIALRNYYGEEK